MRYIEIITFAYDEYREEELPKKVLINLDKINSVEDKQRVPPASRSPSVRRGELRSPPSPDEFVSMPYVSMDGDNYWVTNYSYEDLKRLVTTGGNVRMSGGSV